ncbi:hypothetical protein FBQ95_17255 [Chloroflexi bacterium CFX3]|nr:hypothetical protein [Chloroflexi bacterium CFX3]
MSDEQNQQHDLFGGAKTLRRQRQKEAEQQTLLGGEMYAPARLTRMDNAPEVVLLEPIDEPISEQPTLFEDEEDE